MAGLDARFYKEIQDVFLVGQINVSTAPRSLRMGVDKLDIRCVIHYRMPGDIELCFQETGWAGELVCAPVHLDDFLIHENYFMPQSLPEPEQMADVSEWVRRQQRRMGRSSWILWRCRAVDLPRIRSGLRATARHPDARECSAGPGSGGRRVRGEMRADLAAMWHYAES